MNQLIPFSFEEVKLGDNIVHVFYSGSKRYVVYLGSLYGIQPWISGEMAIYLRGQGDLILPSSWNLYIDRRRRYTKLFDFISNLF